MELGAHDLRLLGQLETVNARHLDVGDQEVDPIVGEEAHCLIPIRCGKDRIARLGKNRDDDLSEVGLIVGKEDCV